ncbi:hypothetical protein LPJ60_005866 [Coemansia sp. RSA 2675]|nr:hypothetical protein LPJ60_005866 [Coemansia sp. RSA 2675]
MSDHRHSPSPASVDGPDSNGHYGFVQERYSSPGSGHPVHQGYDFDENFESSSGDDDGELSVTESGRFLGPFGSVGPSTDGESEEEEDSPDSSQLGAEPPERILIDTQYMIPEGADESITIIDTQYPSQTDHEDERPIVIGDTQLPMPYAESGPILIGDTQMPDAIEIGTSPIRGPHGSTQLVGEGSARRDLKHRMSIASRDEAQAADSKKPRPDDSSEGEVRSPVQRTRTQFKCAVCLEAPDPAVFVHPCGHVFCEGCAQGAVQTTGKCPVCRHAMRTRNIRVLQFRIAPIGRTSN